MKYSGSLMGSTTQKTLRSAEESSLKAKHGTDPLRRSEQQEFRRCWIVKQLEEEEVQSLSRTDLPHVLQRRASVHMLLLLLSWLLSCSLPHLTLYNGPRLTYLKKSINAVVLWMDFSVNRYAVNVLQSVQLRIAWSKFGHQAVLR